VHIEAMTFLAQQIQRGTSPAPANVLELGSRDINGSPRILFPPSVRYVGMDIWPGEGVDIVHDCAEPITPLLGDERFALIICAEVLEHAPRWADIVHHAADALTPDGVLLLTMATDPRQPHSALHGCALEPGEYYGNVPPDALAVILGRRFATVQLHTDRSRGDLYARASGVWPGAGLNV
jgi:SAM-dependent methyltransferase